MTTTSRLSENCHPRPSGGSSPPSPILTPRAHRDKRKALHPRADESEDGYSTHPSIYSASPVGSSDSECGRGQQPDTGVFEQEVDGGDTDTDTDRGGANGELTGRRNFSSFSGLSMLDTISERKSVASTVVLHDEVDDANGDDEFCGDEYSTDDEFGYEYGQPFYYEYASPTQPLHPARSRSAPPREINPLLSHTYQSSSVPVVHTFFSRSPTHFGEMQHSPPPQRPAFRPVQSMNRSYGSLMAHPFHRAPMAESGVRRMMDANAPTPDEIESPTRSRTSLSGERAGGWSRFLKGCCLVCCCLVVDDETPPSPRRH
ncbi:hypothetical protein BZA05DRAFT_329271 [Tricharina praecox]|uniref:uncharacterized protein n=1 Tax=Tricharina praecox TaxID=43433 RepID=UPI00222129F6|nr:uncharacterized protein BZA05DRAFT_329271 [Tricharina praecox]KAI5859188.1 hypothetical protein BZA05DRAFT_329271 [Tricharina praecox]